MIVTVETQAFDNDGMIAKVNYAGKIKAIRLKILIIYSLTTGQLRPSQKEHLRSFQRYTRAKCYYFNIAFRKVPKYLYKTKFSLIVYHWFFLDARRSDYWHKWLSRARYLKTIEGLKIATPQDECSFTERLCEFINEFRINIVFSVAPESEWPVIYPSVDRTSVRFSRVLTGYLDEYSLNRINALSANSCARTIDIGHRTAYRPEWGRFGLYKKILVDAFIKSGKKGGLKVDISDRVENFFVGDDWYRFLLNCKYTIGNESGGSLLDKDGSIAKKCRNYSATHPNATFDDIETECFSGLDGGIRLRALSPRHLEACATRTCQILIEGDYNGILKPGLHYLPIKSDMSNIDEIIDIIKDDRVRKKITDAAYGDIVESGKYTYRAFVSFILQEALGAKYRNDSNVHNGFNASYYWNRLRELLAQLQAVIIGYAKDLIRPLYYKIIRGKKAL